MNRLFSKIRIRSLFSTSHSNVEFNNYYLLRLEYGEDGYYDTYSLRNQFESDIKKIESGRLGKIIGGDNFPKNCTTLLFHCNDVEVVRKFVENCSYNKSKNKLIENWTITPVSKISSNKFETIWNFYMPKIS